MNLSPTEAKLAPMSARTARVLRVLADELHRRDAQLTGAEGLRSVSVSIVFGRDGQPRTILTRIEAKRELASR